MVFLICYGLLIQVSVTAHAGPSSASALKVCGQAGLILESVSTLYSVAYISKSYYECLDDS